MPVEIEICFFAVVLILIYLTICDIADTVRARKAYAREMDGKIRYHFPQRKDFRRQI